MHSLLTASCLATIGRDIPSIVLLFPILTMAVGLLIVIAIFYFKNQERRMWHETARLALEKGQPIPIAPDKTTEGVAPQSENRQTGRRDVRTGVILIAIAVGLCLGKIENGADHPSSIAIYIPGCIGVALLLNALITFLTTRKSPHSPSSPQSPKA